MTKKLEQQILTKKEGKFDFIYFLNVPVFYANVQAPKKKHKSEEKEFSLQAFLTEEAKEQAFNLRLNKSFAKVGVDRKTKGDRGIKFPLSSQVEEGASHYDVVDGLYGISITVDEYTKPDKKTGKRKKRVIKVAGEDGKPTKALIGNGSVCNIKCMYYINNESGDMNIMLNSIKAVKLVPYEAKKDIDDIMGADFSSVDYYAESSDAVDEEAEEELNNNNNMGSEDLDDDPSIPF